LDLRRRAIVGVITAAALVGTGAASAASPQQIYSDLADNGRLDGKYTDADLERALDLPKILGSDAQPRSVRRPSLARGTEARAQQVPREPARAKRRNLPFSGLDLALLTAGGGPLLLIGFALRRRLSAPARAARAARA
jgi:hypothetical protein